MDCPIALSSTEKGYTATALYWPTITAVAPTREAALRGARAQLEQQLAATELVMVEVPGEDAWRDLTGKYADDDRLRDLCDPAYAERDERLVP